MGGKKYENFKKGYRKVIFEWFRIHRVNLNLLVYVEVKVTHMCFKEKIIDFL